MRSFPDATIPSSRNAFSPSFLTRIGERDEPPTAGEADVAGPWIVEEIPPTGWGVFRPGEGPGRGGRPYAVFSQRWQALLAAAALPGTGRDPVFLLQKEQGPPGWYAVDHNPTGEGGFIELFDEKLVDALHVLEILLRSPESLANLMEAAGQVALERAGAILDGRV